MPFDFLADAINTAASTWALAMRAALVQGTLALIIITLFRALLRRHTSHAFAHGLFLLVPVKTLAAAIFVAWPVVIAFSIPVPAFIYKYTGQRTEIHDSTLNNAPIISANSANPSPEIPYQFNDKLIPEPDKSVPLADKFQSSQIPDPVQRLSFQRISKTSFLMIAWLATVLILAMLLFINHLRMIRRLIRLKYEPDPELLNMVRQITAEFRLQRVPTVWPTTAVSAPAVIGLLQPKLLLPVGFFTDLPSNEIRWAILHELAHLKRHDLWWLAFERAIGLALFFHPALWLARCSTRHFRELACDDLAQLQSGLSPRDCAQVFLNIIAWSGRNPSSQTFYSRPLGLMDRYPIIQQRIMNMTESDKKLISSCLSRKAVITIAFLAVVAALPFSPKIVAMPQAPEVQQKLEKKKQTTVGLQKSAQSKTVSSKVPKHEPYNPVDDLELQKQVDRIILDFHKSNKLNGLAMIKNEIDTCRKMIDLGLKNPKSRAAQVAWSWVLEKPHLGLGADYGAEFMRAATLLLAYHGDSPYVASQSLWMDNIPSPEHDQFIYGLNTAARSPETLGHAKLGLANYLHTKSIMVKNRKKNTGRGFIGFITKDEKGDPVTIKQPESDMAYAYAMQLQLIDTDSLDKQSLQLYEEVIRDFADIPLKSSKTRDLEAALKLATPEMNGRKFGTIEIASIKKHLETNSKKTLGNVARAKLDEIQNLVAGKPAPEIEAEGVKGKKFKLSDYRGKAVLLVFWGTWCGPCMAEVPHERKIAEKYKDKPFTIIGVNCDEDRRKAAEVMETEKMNWPNFYDGTPGDGPISQKYHIRAYPTTFLIDANGIMRYRDLRGESLDKAIGEILKKSDELKNPAKTD